MDNRTATDITGPLKNKIKNKNSITNVAMKVKIPDKLIRLFV